MVRRHIVSLGALAWSYGALLLVLKSPWITGGSIRPDPTSDPARLAFAILQAAPTFSSAAVGEAGITPSEVLAWRTLLWSADAGTRFKDLLATGSPAGQLYALTGLRVIDPAFYRQAVTRVGRLGGTVQTVRGCIVMNERVADLVREIDEGRWTSELLAGRTFPAVTQ